jgi:hypothetical protein
VIYADDKAALIATGLIIEEVIGTQLNPEFDWIEK